MNEMFAPFDFTGITLTPPTRTFSNEFDLRVGGKAVRLINVGPAHTKGDTLVVLPEDRIVFTGDILFNEGTPIAWAGPVDNWIKACDLILGMDVDVVVPGHGAVADKPVVRGMREYLQYVKDEAFRRFQNGMPAEEAAFDIPLGSYADWGDAERIVVTVATVQGHAVRITDPAEGVDELCSASVAPGSALGIILVGSSQDCRDLRCGPTAAPGGPDPASIEGCGDAAKADHAATPDLYDYGGDILGEPPCFFGCTRSTLQSGLGQVRRVTKPGTLFFAGLQGCAGSFGDHPTLLLGQGGIDVQHERVDVGAELGHKERHALHH